MGSVFSNGAFCAAQWAFVCAAAKTTPVYAIRAARYAVSDAEEAVWEIWGDTRAERRWQIDLLGRMLEP